MRHPAQEQDVVPGRAIAGIGAGVIVASAIGVAVAYGIGACRSHQAEGAWQFPRGPEIPPEVNAMETRVFDVEAQGIELNARAEEFLWTWGWVDRDRGIVHVPIDVAYELLLARQGGRR